MVAVMVVARWSALRRVLFFFLGRDARSFLGVVVPPRILVLAVLAVMEKKRVRWGTGIRGAFD